MEEKTLFNVFNNLCYSFIISFFGVHFYSSNKQVIVDSNLPLVLAEIFMFLVFGSFALYYLVRYILLFKDIDNYKNMK